MQDVRIYIVDNNPQFSDMMSDFLSRQEGLEIVGRASSGEEAIAELSSLECDVVLMDITMPNMNGLEAAKQLRDKRVHCGVILISMNGDLYYHKAAMLAGARALVTKDRFCEEIVDTIHRVADRGSSIDRSGEAQTTNAG